MKKGKKQKLKHLAKVVKLNNQFRDHKILVAILLTSLIFSVFSGEIIAESVVEHNKNIAQIEKTQIFSAEITAEVSVTEVAKETATAKATATETSDDGTVTMTAESKAKVTVSAKATVTCKATAKTTAKTFKEAKSKAKIQAEKKAEAKAKSQAKIKAKSKAKIKAKEKAKSKAKDEAESKAKALAEEKAEEATEETTEEYAGWDGPVLNESNGRIQGPSGEETYYNMDMTGVISIMESMGYNYEYSIREDGVKLYGGYVMCAANLDLRPRGSFVQTSLGMGIVCDTGSFAEENPTQLDIAVNWGELE